MVLGMMALAALLVVSAPAYAGLTTFKVFTGTVGLSTDGWGSLDASGTISASVPSGSTVLAAYLYASMWSTFTPSGSTLGGTAVAYGPPVVNGSAPFLASARADVTTIVKPLIDGGPGGVYNFTVTEGSSYQDGEALVVVYSNAALPTATVGILDGWASVTGDTATLGFATPLNPIAPGFFADMRLGIGHSFPPNRRP